MKEVEEGGLIPGSVPVVSCEEARALEARLFGGDEAKEWAAMQRAGRAIAAAVLRDFEEIGGFPARGGRVLVLAGKGHNGGDALIAAAEMARRRAEVRVEVVLVFGERSLRPLAARAWRELASAAGVELINAGSLLHEGRGYDVCLDGVFGFQFRPPVDARVRELLEGVNALAVRLRAAVDLPSAGVFRADFCYATGSVKAPVVTAAEAGRVRYLDLGFFRGDESGSERVLTSGVLEELRRFRASASDKRTFGHVFVVGGSRNFPGAVLMTVLAALRSGAGLVTAFVPESVAPAFAARAPEAMWVAWPETPDGGLALEGEGLLREKSERATALVIGPGMGREKETLALAESIVGAAKVPVVVDADALQPEIVRAGAGAKVITPHAGEWARVRAVVGPGTVVVEKGPVTKVRRGDGPVYHSFFGGPVLARGGSGDVLAGLVGGLLAQAPGEALLAAARGVVWHGRAADELARRRGQVAVSVTQLLDYLPEALRESEA